MGHPWPVWAIHGPYGLSRCLATDCNQRLIPQSRLKPTLEIAAYEFLSPLQKLTTENAGRTTFWARDCFAYFAVKMTFLQ